MEHGEDGNTMDFINQFASSPLSGLFLGLSFNDFAKPIGVFFWITILLVPIRSLPGADLLLGFMYAAYLGLVAALLIVALPAAQASGKSISDHATLGLCMAVALMRWHLSHFLGSMAMEKGK
jgi:hypothetical protein